MLKHLPLYIDSLNTLCSLPMKETQMQHTGTWILRNMHTDLMCTSRVEAFAERKTIHQLLMRFVDEHLTNLGLLPKWE